MNSVGTYVYKEGHLDPTSDLLRVWELGLEVNIFYQVPEVIIYNI